MLQNMEQNIVTKGKALEDKDKEIAAEKRKLQLKLKKQKHKEMQLKEEKLKEKEEKLFYEQQYNSVQEELQANREVIKELRGRYKAALEEIKDLEHEQELKHSNDLNDL